MKNKIVKELNDGSILTKVDNGYVIKKVEIETVEKDGFTLEIPKIKEISLAFETLFSKGWTLENLEIVFSDYKENGVPMDNTDFYEIKRYQRENNLEDFDIAKEKYQEEV